MQLVENKLLTMRTKEVIKKEKLLIPLWTEGEEGGRERARETPSMYQDTSEECRIGEVQYSRKFVVGGVTCCFSLPY